MITPLVGEEEWIQALAGLQSWRPPSKPTVVIAPHPDDETLGAGGLIAWQRERDVEVSVIAVTDGEAAYLDGKEEQLASIRQAEQENALHTLLVPRRAIVRLHLPDSKVAAHEDELRKCLVRVIRPDSLVIAPWPLDWHPDHEACGRAVTRVAEAAGAELLFYLFWTWHCKTVESLSREQLRRLELDSRIVVLKREALNCHVSQLKYEFGDPILPERFLGPAKRPFETFILHE